VATCARCGARARLSELATGGLQFRTVLVERAGAGRREIARARAEEIARADGAEWSPSRALGPIPEGSETQVLLRHGFRALEDLYPARQRVVLEALLAATDAAAIDEDARAALRLVALGSTEMAGHLSRWDRFYLKAYEAMASHRFNFTTLPTEPHVRGCREAGRGTWLRRLAQAERAARWWREHLPAGSTIQVTTGSSEQLRVPDASVDVALTDPPYHDDVSYSELSLPLRAWAGLPQALDASGAAATPRAEEDYGDVLARIFSEVRRALKPSGRLVFSYANREPEAWVKLLDALQRAGFRGAGFAVVHSENERDASKRGVRSCNLDVLLELVPATGRGKAPSRTAAQPASDEEHAFCEAVGGWVLRVGSLRNGWQAALAAELRAQPFLTAARPGA
jgi:SAM-dependent methyltransferase